MSSGSLLHEYLEIACSRHPNRSRLKKPGVTHVAEGHDGTRSAPGGWRRRAHEILPPTLRSYARWTVRRLRDARTQMHRRTLSRRS